MDELQDEAAEDARAISVEIPSDAAGLRLDRALADLTPDDLSRSRIGQLIAEGALSDEAGRTLAEPARKVKAGEVLHLRLPAPVAAEPEPEAIPLAICHEDDDLIVVDKPSGMVVHPAPGAETGTLVNALLHHCGPSLAGIGGVRRPGIVHRIDKDTSGLIVAAKTEAAHRGLSALFASHEIERRYAALCHGVPDRADARLAGLEATSFEPGGWIRIEASIARHPTDRKRMAVATGRGRHAVTRLRVLERLSGPSALIECRLETGRTHQIRVHASHIGHPLLGDPVYGTRRKLAGAAAEAVSALGRQALHAASLGFQHPVTGAAMQFESVPPDDFRALQAALTP